VLHRKPIQGRFEGKVAIVTGGASGIGHATVHEFCREGGSVVFTDIELDRGSEIETELASAKLEARFIHGDMADAEFASRVTEYAFSRFGRVDCLVNNAFSFIAKAADATLDDWRRSLEVGPVAYARMGGAAADAMRKTGGGSIVNISSVSAFVAQPGRWTYNTSKGAVHILTKCMALDFAPHGIRVNSVSPGWIWTREVLKAADGDRAKWDSIWGQFHMLERCGDAVEVSAAVLFLLSDDASFITAADLAVDGGYGGLGSEGLGKLSRFAGSK
jgi:NAD(P)-dependent dehydrogenase (short-subunit alcohol dehydrogenase family)